MQSIVDFLYMVDDMLWGTPMVVIVLGTGIFLSLRFGFSYQRKLKFNIKNTFGNMTSAGEGVGTVSSFRAACTGLANTVGTGNISGVATVDYIFLCQQVSGGNDGRSQFMKCDNAIPEFIATF